MEKQENTNRQGLKIGDWLRCWEINPGKILHGKVAKFYPLKEGGEGVEIIKCGGGIISASMPLDWINVEEIFKTQQESQHSIDSRNPNQ